MKKIQMLISQLFMLALLATPFIASSCSDDDEPFVGIANMGIAEGATVYVGQEVNLKIEQQNLEGAISYVWTVNGEVVDDDDDDDYTFVADKKGTYTVGVKATATNGTYEKAVTLHVAMYPATFFVVNEGQMGKSKGNINKYENGEWKYNLVKEGLGNTTSTGVIYDKHLYAVSKNAPFLAKIDMNNLSVVDRLDDGLGANGQGCSFRVINKETGVLTTSNGAFKVDLNNLKSIQKLEGFENARNLKSDIHQAGEYVFITCQNKVKVYNAKDLSFKKDLAPTVNTGFTVSKDGSLWGANEKNLVKINVKSLDAEEIAVPDNRLIYFNNWAYTPCTISASTAENALYFVEKTGSGYNTFAKNIYKYDIDKKTATLFFEAPAEDKSVYGTGINVNPSNGDVYLIYTEDGWGNHYLNTNIYVADGVSGDRKAIIDYSGTFWFPSMICFN